MCGPRAAREAAAGDGHRRGKRRRKRSMAWPGGKDGSGVVQRLINQIPPHDVFVSAFLGDCAILRKKLPAKLSIGIDLDRANIERWAKWQAGAPGAQFGGE